MESPHFDRIPEEIIILIFSLLPTTDLCSMANMSSRLNRLARTRSLWINADIDLSKVPRAAVSHLHNATKNVSIDTTPDNHGSSRMYIKLLEDIQGRCPNLTSMSLRQGMFHTITYRSQSRDSNDNSMWNNLEAHLDINGDMIEDMFFQAQVCNVVKQYLHEDTKCLTICPIIKGFSYTRKRPLLPLSLLKIIMQMCPKMTRINVHNCELDATPAELSEAETDIEYLLSDVHGKVKMTRVVFNSHTDIQTEHIYLTVTTILSRRNIVEDSSQMETVSANSCCLRNVKVVLRVDDDGGDPFDLDSFFVNNERIGIV
jgi:hypothetical protein